MFLSQPPMGTSKPYGCPLLFISRLGICTFGPKEGGPGNWYSPKSLLKGFPSGMEVLCNFKCPHRATPPVVSG